MGKQAMDVCVRPCHGSARVADCGTAGPRAMCLVKWYSPTQPYPTMPAPYDKQSVTEENLIAWR